MITVEVQWRRCLWLIARLGFAIAVCIGVDFAMPEDGRWFIPRTAVDLVRYGLAWYMLFWILAMFVAGTILLGRRARGMIVYLSTTANKTAA